MFGLGWLKVGSWGCCWREGCGRGSEGLKGDDASVLQRGLKERERTGNLLLRWLDDVVCSGKRYRSSGRVGGWRLWCWDGRRRRGSWKRRMSWVLGRLVLEDESDENIRRSRLLIAEEGFEVKKVRESAVGSQDVKVHLSAEWRFDNEIPARGKRKTASASFGSEKEREREQNCPTHFPCLRFFTASSFSPKASSSTRISNARMTFLDEMIEPLRCFRSVEWSSDPL